MAKARAAEKEAPKSIGRPSSRERILEAACALAKEVGPAGLSLDAVAERAGVSKGGLLYHFPHKSELFRAIVEDHMAEMDRIMDEAEARCREEPHSIAAVHIDAYRHECAPMSGVLAVIAEDPDFLKPIREKTQRTIARIKRTSAVPELGLIAFLAIEGMRCLRLFEIEALTAKDEAAVLDCLSQLVAKK
jgi:AcrR family transcriptional regulator